MLSARHRRLPQEKKTTTYSCHGIFQYEVGVILEGTIVWRKVRQRWCHRSSLNDESVLRHCRRIASTKAKLSLILKCSLDNLKLEIIRKMWNVKLGDEWWDRRWVKFPVFEANFVVLYGRYGLTPLPVSSVRSGSTQPHFQLFDRRTVQQYVLIITEFSYLIVQSSATVGCRLG